MARQVLNNNVLYGEQRLKINENFEELYDIKLEDINAGVVEYPDIIYNVGANQIEVGTGKYNLYYEDDFVGTLEPIVVVGTVAFSPAANVTNYLILNYQGGVPQLQNTTNPNLVNESNIIPIAQYWIRNNSLKINRWGEIGLGLANRINLALMQGHGIERKDGLYISEVATRIVKITEGKAYYGTKLLELSDFNSNTDHNRWVFFRHVSSNWEGVENGGQYNNQYYDNGDHLVGLNDGKYTVNYVYRMFLYNPFSCYLLGDTQYDTIDQARASKPPRDLPNLIEHNGILVGRIIVKKNASSGVVESHFDPHFAQTIPTKHDDLDDIKNIGTGVDHGHISDGEETIFGLKTFDEFPKTPEDDPLEDYDVANKQYVDKAIGEGGSIMIQDEGVEAGVASVLNFVGADVTALLEEGIVNVYIPPPDFVSNFNTTNGSSNALVGNIATTSRRVSNPTNSLTGDPFDKGLWPASSNQDCINNPTFSYQTNGLMSILNNVDTTFTVRIEGRDTSTILSEKTITLIGNTVQSGTGILITVTNWSLDATKFKANIKVDIDLDDIIPNGGRFNVKLTHNNGSDGIFTKEQNNMFYDNEPLVAYLGNGVTTIDEVLGSVQTRFISGVEYYDLGSVFEANVTRIDNINAISFPATVLQVYGDEFGLPTLNVNADSLDNYDYQWDNIEASYTNTTWSITQTGFFTKRLDARIRSRALDWDSKPFQYSVNYPLIIDTRTNASTDTIERFFYESYRCPLTGDFDLTNQKVWNSSDHLLAGDACFYNGGCERNTDDFTSFNPNTVSQPNYTASQDTTVYLIREFITDGTSYANARINILGSYDSLEVKLAKAWDGTNTGGTVWLDCNSAYNAGEFNNGNPNGGTGCRIGSGAGYIDITFGSQNTANTGDTVYLKIGFKDSERIIGTLSMVFS